MGCGAGKYKPETFVLPHQQNAAPVKKMPQQPEQQKTELPAAANPPQPKKLEPIKNAGDSPFDNTSVESVIAEIAAKYKVSEELQEKTLQTLHDNGIFIMEGFRDMREDHWDKLGIPLLIRKALQERLGTGAIASASSTSSTNLANNSNSNNNSTDDLPAADTAEISEALSHVSAAGQTEQQARIKQMVANSVGGLSYQQHLMDAWELLFKRHEGATKSMTDIANYIRMIAKTEKEYATKLYQIAQAQNKELQKTQPIMREQGTTGVCFEVLFGNLEVIAAHHNQTADKLETLVVQKIINYNKDMQKTRKVIEAEAAKITKEMKVALENLQKARTRYVQASSEADQASTAATKAANDPSVKTAQLQKLQTKATQCLTKAASMDNEYKTLLAVANRKQSEYYNQSMPALLAEFQQFEEKRTKFMKDMLDQYASLYGDRVPFYTSSAQSITGAVTAVNTSADLQQFINQNKTGVSVPEDIPYVTWSETVDHTARYHVDGSALEENN